MTDLTLSNFWQGKKVAALILSFIVVVASMVLNQVYSLGIDVNVIFAILGLNTVFILTQGSIDSKKTGQNAFKPFWESRKFLAIAVGNVIPVVLAAVNKKYETGITSEMILGLLGINAVYVMRQGALDSKEPNKH